MIVNKSLNELMNKKEIIVCDYDGVIQSLEARWMENLLEPEIKALFNDYFDFKKLGSTVEDMIHNLFKRETYYIDVWLTKEGLVLPQELKRKFSDIYMHDMMFYKKSPFLTMYEGLQSILDLNFVEKIIFLSSTPDERTTDIRKYNMVKNKFHSNKVDLVIIPGYLKKHEWIIENCPNYTTFIDDRADIVKGVIENTNIQGKTFILPEYGYNRCIKEDKELLLKVEQAESVISMYVNKILV